MMKIVCANANYLYPDCKKSIINKIPNLIFIVFKSFKISLNWDNFIRNNDLKF